MLRLYRSLIRSKLDYGCIVYSSARDYNIRTLNVIHHTGIRLATGAFRTSPVLSICAESGEPPLAYRRKRLAASYAANLISKPKCPAYSAVFRPRFANIYAAKPRATRPFGIRFAELRMELSMEMPKTLKIGLNKVPPWTIPCPSVCLRLTAHPKTTTSPALFNQHYLELRSSFGQHIPVFTDGSKNADLVGCAVVAEDMVLRFKLTQYCSNYTAELYALSKAIDYISRFNNQTFVIYTDSLSSLQAMDQLYSCHTLICLIQDNLLRLRQKNVKVTFCWIPSHVGIPDNERADRAAKAAASEGSIENVVLSYDLKAAFVKAVNSLWQSEWETVRSNKLRVIKPTVNAWLSSSREERWEEVVLTRLRIGHCRLTHSYCFTREEPPLCETCDVELSVVHILEECVQYQDQKERSGLENNLHIILGDDSDSINRLIRFLKDTGLCRYL